MSHPLLLDQNRTRAIRQRSMARIRAKAPHPQFFDLSKMADPAGATRMADPAANASPPMIQGFGTVPPVFAEESRGSRNARIISAMMMTPDVRSWACEATKES